MSSPAVRPTRVRHIILWLTVLLYMVTYFDRVLISTAMPSIQKEFGFSIQTVGLILAAFQLSYSLFQIPGGWLLDRFGSKRVYTFSILLWSLSLLRYRGLPLMAGTIGLCCSAVPLGLLASGHLAMNVRGFGTFVLLQAVFAGVAGLVLVRTPMQRKPHEGHSSP